MTQWWTRRIMPCTYCWTRATIPWQRWMTERQSHMAQWWTTDIPTTQWWTGGINPLTQWWTVWTIHSTVVNGRQSHGRGKRQRDNRMAQWWTGRINPLTRWWTEGTVVNRKNKSPDTVVTRSHEMSLNLKFGNLRYLHASNQQVLLVILILKSRFYSKRCGCDAFLKVACVAEAILRKSALKFSLCIE